MGPSRRVFIAALVMLCASGPRAEEPADRAPVPLRTPRLETPIETAGTGLAPEVRVRLRIDPRGRVADVEVLSIAPASDFDDRFEAVTRETLTGWRYAPALSEGKPVAAELSWTVQFPERAPAEDEPDVEDEDPLAGLGSDGDPWQRILALPADVRRRLLERITDAARVHLVPKRVRSHETDRFVVYTDVNREGAARRIGEELEAAYDVMEGLLEPLVVSRPAGHKLSVVVYATEEQFIALSLDVLRVDWAAGFYNPAGLLALHDGLATRQSVVATLLHEAAHGFVDNHLARPGVVLPRWLGEGFAEYVGNSAIKKGQLVPGRTPRSQIYWRGFRASMGRSEQAFGVERVRQAMRDGAAPSLDQLVAADPRTFYGPRRQVFYATSWLLVHFLRHGQPGWSEREFPRLMLYAAEGYPAEVALRDVYGQPLAELERRFREYVRTF